MSITVTSLDELPQDLVDQLFAEATQMMQEKHPEVELMRGPFHDLVLLISSQLQAVPQINLDKFRRSTSLQAIQADPTLADPDIVDQALSNHRVVRKGGSKAVGAITIVVATNQTVTIQAGLVFEANGLQFAADGVFSGRPVGSTLTVEGDRYLDPLADGNYSFAIEATAVEEGEESNISRGTKMLPQAIAADFVTAFATQDFVNGFAEESNEELLVKLVEGDAAKTMGGETNYIALIKTQEKFERTLNYSVIGMHNAEMTRDQHSILPISFGGRVDIYSQTRALPVSQSVLVDAVLIDIVATGSIWQFAITRDMAPGFYEVERIVRATAIDEAGYEVTMDLRGMDLSGPGRIPDIVTAGEAAYTRYQTTVIRFLDTDTSTTNLTLGDVATYQADILAMPLITELQEFCNGRGTGSRASDTLIKAAVPCFLSVSFDVRKGAAEVDPDTDAIANDLADVVNHLGFTGQLHASLLASTIHKHLTGRQAVGKIEMFGRIRRPDGSQGWLRDTGLLKIPDDPARAVTGSTTVFLLDPANIAASVISAGFSND